MLTVQKLWITSASAMFIPALCGNILHELITGDFFTPSERADKLF
jgi:hypothetical protein